MTAETANVPDSPADTATFAFQAAKIRTRRLRLARRAVNENFPLVSVDTAENTTD
jgi:hypothetical protein